MCLADALKSTDGVMGVEVNLKHSVESTGKNSAVTLCTGKSLWLSPHGCFAKICSSIQRRKLLFRTICISLCDHDIELDRMLLAFT